MPTAGRLVAAVLFAPLVWYVSQLALPVFALNEIAPPRMFVLVNVGLALILGWVVAGSRAGKGTWMGAVSYGLTTVIAISVVCLFIHAFVEMIALSLRRRYDGPAEAVIGVFDLMFDYARLLALPDLIVLFVAGGVLAGLVTEWFGRNFR